MDDEKTISDVQNPHDKLFRETWSDLENAKSFLHNRLPSQVLALMEKSIPAHCDPAFDLPW